MYNIVTSKILSLKQNLEFGTFSSVLWMYYSFICDLFLSQLKMGDLTGKKVDEDEDDEESLDWWSRYYETVKDEEREEEEKRLKENKPQKTNESMKKSKKNAEDGDVESEKRVKKPNSKITRLKVFIWRAFETLNIFLRSSV